MLHHDILAGPDSGPEAPVLVLLHGRGADPGDLTPLRRVLPERLNLVLPRAPFEGAPWGYGPGWAWYRYEGEDRPEEESFRTSQAELERFLDALPDQLEHAPGKIFLGGFSQGGTMSIGYAMRRPGAVDGVVNFSGFVPRHPDVEVVSGSAEGLEIFWGHGTMDPAIPFTMATAGRERLRAAGASLETRDYPMGHGISPEEMRDAVAWMTR